MGKLIEVGKALQAVDKRIEELYKMEVFRKKADNIDVLGVKKWINNIPTVDAIPIEAIKKAFADENNQLDIADSFDYSIEDGIASILRIIEELAESEDKE